MTWSGTFVVLLAAGLLLPTFRLFAPDQLSSMLVVHLLLELFGIVVSILVVAAAWHTLDRARLPANQAVIFGFAVIAGLDSLHALSYAGMPTIFGPPATDRGIFFWLVGRTA